MAISMNLWSIDENKSLNLIPKSKIELEEQLESWIIDDPTILDLDFMILGRQVHTDHGGYIDILGMNREGDIIIIELKRHKTPRDVVAQCLDYASWVSDLNYGKITDIHKKYTGKNIENEYQTEMMIYVMENEMA
jgi:RecB family endonuclease NucS